MTGSDHRGFSLVGILVTMGIIIILFAISLSALKNATGGGGNTAVQENQFSTFADRENLRRLGIGLATFSTMNNNRLPAPTIIAGSRDKSLDTSANFWSAMIAQGYTAPASLISENEQNPNVFMDDDYSRSAVRPAAGAHWDPGFKADLDRESNVSFAHLVLHGERFERYWSMQSPADYPLIGNRGPRDGVANPDSYTCDPQTGVWRGNLLYADGHVDFQQTATPAGLWFEAGSSRQQRPDNIFAVESGDNGADCILSFTRQIWNGGFDLQFD